MYCTLTLISTTFSFNTTVLPPKKSVQVALHAVCFLPCKSLTKLCDFSYPISGLIQNSIPNFKTGLALHFQNMMRAAAQENVFGLCNTQRVLLKGSSKVHCLYKVYIFLHFTVPCRYESTAI